MSEEAQENAADGAAAEPPTHTLISTNWARVEYKRMFSDGNYGNESAGVTVDVVIGEGDDALVALARELAAARLATLEHLATSENRHVQAAAQRALGPYTVDLSSGWKDADRGAARRRAHAPLPEDESAPDVDDTPF